MAAIPFIPGCAFLDRALGQYRAAALVAMDSCSDRPVGGFTSFGQAAFCGFGAYTTAVLTTAMACRHG